MKFTDVVEINPRISLKKGINYPFVEMANVSTNSREPSLVIEEPFSSGVKFEKNDSVIARIEPCLQNGKRFFCKYIEQGFGSTEYLVFRTKDKKQLDNTFLWYFLYSDHITKSMINSMSGATGRQRVNNDIFKSLDITLPPLPTQQKIASVLSAYDDLIENNRKQIKLLEEAALKLYKEWFVKLNFPGHENTKIADGVPDGWKEVAIGNLCIRVNAGGTPNRKKTEYWDKHEVKWFKTKELQDCWLFDAEEYISEKGLNNSSAKIFPENTILMAIYASPTLGRLGILTDDACCNQAALCMVADEEKISYQWLYLKLMELRDYFNSVARGAGQQNISGDVVKNKIVLVPEKKLMEEFTSITKPYFNKIKNCQLSIVNLQSARDKLLPKLMNGEIEV